MIYLLYFYIAFTYLFEIGCALAPDGSNWYDFMFAPIIFPIKIGRMCAMAFYFGLKQKL